MFSAQIVRGGAKLAGVHGSFRHCRYAGGISLVTGNDGWYRGLGIRLAAWCIGLVAKRETRRMPFVPMFTTDSPTMVG